jgi:hypothetical protein
MPTTASAEDLTQQARFVFVASVVRLQAATMAQVPVTDRTAIVRVDKVLLAPETLGDWTGKEITVQLSGRSRIQEGQQYVFYTNGWLFGESIAVQAVDQRPVTAELTAQGGEPAHALAERDLQAHSAGADLIVTGKVLSVRLPTAGVAVAGGPAPHKLIKEHDPEWREAVIEIESVVKGSHPEQQLVVQYPASTDIAWYKAPKLQPGDEGVLLLHKAEGPMRETAAAYAILDVMDFQPRSKLEQISASIKASTNS